MMDRSVEESGDRVNLHLFASRPEDMPSADHSDVVVLKAVKVQYFQETYSLLSNRATDMFIFKSSSLSSGATPVIVPWGKNCSRAGKPSPAETKQACTLYSGLKKDNVPSVIDFGEKKAQSMNVRNKRSALGGVQNKAFYDILAQAVSEPFAAASGCVMLWISDYSENGEFWDYASPDSDGKESADAGDACKYLTKFGKQVDAKPANWSGPHGRRSMLVTFFPPHAEHVQEENVKRGTWIDLRNLHVKYGRDGRSLEGFLHDDPERGSPLLVRVIDTTDLDSENADPRYMEALLRKRQYIKASKHESKAGKKRKAVADAAAEGRSNARQRRVLERENKRRKDGATEGGAAAQRPPQSAVNSAVVSEHSDQDITPLAVVLDRTHYRHAATGLQLPFLNIKFKAQVRVVDFVPKRLLDFSVQRRVSEFDAAGLEPDADDSSSDEEGGSDCADRLASADRLVWEWRFALLLEDATDATTADADASGVARPRVWAVVNNSEGQLLTNMNACNLRQDRSALRQLRETLFLLWGNLEDMKQAAERQERQAARAKDEAAEAAAAAARRQNEAAKKAEDERTRRAAAKQAKKEQDERARQRQAQTASGLKKYPAPAELGSSDAEDNDGGDGHSSPSPRAVQTAVPPADEEEGADKTWTPRQTASGHSTDATTPAEPALKLSNRPFVCCVHQYGISACRGGESGAEKTEIAEIAAADAKEGGEQSGDDGQDGGRSQRAWRPMFGLFGTTIKAG